MEQAGGKSNKLLLALNMSQQTHSAVGWTADGADKAEVLEIKTMTEELQGVKKKKIKQKIYSQNGCLWLPFI